MEKRYFWIKLKEDFFDSEQMDFIHDMPNGAEYIYIYLRLCLRFANNDGIVERRIGPDVRLSYDMQKLAEIVHSTTDSVVVAIQVFKQIGLVEEIHNGAFIIPGVRDMVGSESAVAQRVRKHRALKRMQESQPLLQCNENVTLKVTTENRDKRLDTRDKSIDKDIEKKSRKRRFSVCDAIDGLPFGDALKASLKAWAVMRKEDLKAPVSEKALRLGISKLQKLCGANEEAMVDVVDQSTFNDWKGFFPLKGERRPPAMQDRRAQMKQAVEKGGW